MMYAEIDGKRKISQGNTAEIYDFGDDKVLKLFRDGISSDLIELEYVNSGIAASKLAEVPKVYELSEYEGRKGIVFQKIDGIDMLNCILSNPLKLRRYMKNLAYFHTKINMPVSDSMRTVCEKLMSEIMCENYLSQDEKSIISEYLTKLPVGDCLCHGDFHPGNVMLSGDKVFYIDWMSA